MSAARLTIIARLTATVVGGRLRAVRREAGFTLIEMVLATMMLMIISAPIAAVLSQGAAIGKLARERTGADQLAQAQIEWVRTLPYTWVGLTNGNPPGKIAASTSMTLPSGEAVTVAYKITFVNDPIPTAYVTNADYKKVVLTITRNSDGKQLTQKTTYVASASAPPFAGSDWVQIKRQVIDAVTSAALVGASVNLTGGPSSENRNDTTDGSGTVLFPALDSSSTSTPVYTLTTTFPGYYVFPDDISPGSASSVSSTPGLNSNGVIRMYLPTSLTITVYNSSGSQNNSGAYVSLDSSRCGVQQATIPAGLSSITLTTCNYATNKTVPLPPNLLGQVPSFDSYYVTAWSKTGNGSWTPGTAVTVPAAYPNTLTQNVNVTYLPTAYTTTKNIAVTVKKSGSNDSNARVEVTGGVVGVYLFGTTNSSGQVTIAVPVDSTSRTFTINANDMGVAKGTSTVSLSASSNSTTNVTVNIS
jgi:type II secretory pathway pseudopilin PulG